MTANAHAGQYRAGGHEPETRADPGQEQDRRIAELEKTVKLLRAAGTPAAEAAPAHELAKVVIKPPGARWQNPLAWAQIREGMSPKEVREILGEPVDAHGANLLGLSTGESVWKDDKTTITVRFLNDKVVSKEMTRGEKKGPSEKKEERS